MKYLSSAITLFLILILIPACSFLLDPENCTSDSDCQGGICQEGICVGEIKIEQKDKNISDAMQDLSIEDMDINDMQADKDKDMLQPIDMTILVDQQIDDMTWLFTCDFDPSIDNGIQEGYALYQNQLYTKQAQIKIPLSIALPSALSKEHIKLKTANAGVNLSLIEENQQYWAQLSFDQAVQGEFIITLEISDQQIYCSQILTLTRDITAPQITLISPNNTSALFGLGASPERTVSRQLDVLIDANDQTPMTVFVNGQVPSNDMLSGFSSQSFTLNLELNGGNNDFTVEVEDLLGQRSMPLVLSYQFDQIKPTLVLDPLPNQINQALFSISGLVTDAQVNDMLPMPIHRAQVTLIRQDQNQQVISAVELLTDENGSFEGGVNLSLGLNYVKVCVLDFAENQRCQLIQNIQYSPPAPCIDIDSSRFSDSLSFDITGTACAPVSRINAYLDNRNLGSFSPSNQLNSNGLKSFTIPLMLSAFGSSQRLRLEAFTNTPNQAPAIQEIDLLSDNTAPEVRITQPVNQLCVAEGSVQVCGNVTDEQSQIAEARINGRVVNLVDGSFCTNVDLINGLQNLVLSATNGSNLSSNQQISIQRDNIAPQITFDLAEQSWYPILDNRVSIAGSINVQGCAINAQGLRIKTKQSNGSFGNVTNPALSAGRFNYVTGINLSGDYAIQAEITDTANNTRIVDYAFKADAIAPQINILEPVLSNSFTQASSTTIRLTAFDIHSGLQRVLVNQQQLSFTLNNGIAEISQLVNLNPGVNQIEIKAIDAVGFEQLKTISIERDITPPSITILEPSINKGLHTKERVILNVQDNASGVNRVVVNGVDAIQNENTWIAEGAVIDPNQPKISVFAIDMVGNQSQTKEQAGLMNAYAAWYPSQSGLSTQVFEQIAWLNTGGISLLAYPQSTNSNHATLFKKTISGQGQGFQEQALNALPKFTVNQAQNPALVGTIANLQAFLATGSIQNQASWDAWYFNIQGQLLSRASELDNSRLVHAQLWVDLNSDSRLDLLSVVSNPDQSLINGNTTAILAFSQNIDGTFTLESTDDLGLLGISSYDHLCVADVNQDSLPDVIAGNATAAMMWKRVLGGTSNFEVESNFTSRPLETCITLDWDHDGKLDLITRAGSQLYRTEFDGTWTNQSLRLLNQEVKGWLVTDLDLDLSQELLLYGSSGLQLIDQSGDLDLETLGISMNMPIFSADIIDYDNDLDEDIALATAQGIILLLANRSFSNETVNPIVLKIKRGDSLSADANFTQVFLDLDRNNSFERVLQARANGNTLLYIDSLTASQINVKVTFPDQGTPLNQNKYLNNRALGSIVDVIDTQ